MRVDLGKDRWADIVDPDEMSTGSRMRVQEHLAEFRDENAHAFLVTLRMRRKLIAEVITEWSLELPLPRGNPELLDDVPGSAFDKLKEATEPHFDRLDFIQDTSNSSGSKTPSAGTSSQAKSRTAKQ